MRVFISVDMEGIAGVVNLSHVTPRGWNYEAARRWMTREVATVARKLHELGADEVTVADAHGMMVNLILDELPEYVEVVSGFPRTASMVHGIWDGYDAAIFLGYHARAMSPAGVLSHTFFREYRRIEVNGRVASELLINAYLAGENGVPVILVSGDEATCSEARELISGVETVVTKIGINRWAARLRSPKAVLGDLEKAVEKAVAKLKRGETRPVSPEKPIKISLEFSYPEYADVAELIPGARRAGDTRVEFTFNSFLEAYKVLELTVMAGLGMRYLVSLMTR